MEFSVEEEQIERRKNGCIYECVYDLNDIYHSSGECGDEVIKGTEYCKHHFEEGRILELIKCYQRIDPEVVQNNILDIDRERKEKKKKHSVWIKKKEQLPWITERNKDLSFSARDILIKKKEELAWVTKRNKDLSFSIKKTRKNKKTK